MHVNQNKYKKATYETMFLIPFQFFHEKYIYLHIFFFKAEIKARNIQNTPYI